MEVGRVIGTTSLRQFRFVIKDGQEKWVKRDEFITVREAVTQMEIIGIVKDILISNELLPDEFGRDMHMDNIILTDGEHPIPLVKIVGYEAEDGSGLELPRYGINPGAVVELADDETLKNLLKQNPDVSAMIGVLSTREGIPIHISINELISKHFAVLAMTGAGKSYTVGVLIEELMKKQGSLVVFDPHGEYNAMEFDDSDVVVYGLEGGEEEGRNRRIKIEVSSLGIGDFFNLIPGLTDPQYDLLSEVINQVSKVYKKYDLHHILNFLNILFDIKNKRDINSEKYPEVDIYPEGMLSEMAKKVGFSTIGALMRRISALDRMGIFELYGTPVTDIANKNQLTVINLSDADERISETIIAAICRGIFLARKRHEKEDSGVKLKYPVLLTIEEAHNFAPRSTDDRPVLSRGVLRKIAREGRKFGVGLCIVSQRPNKLDADVLSQCNSLIIMKIVNPSDQEYIRQSVETVTEDIVRDLPSLARGEAIIVGGAIKLPVTVKIRKRETAVGGADINIVGAWSE